MIHLSLLLVPVKGVDILSDSDSAFVLLLEALWHPRSGWDFD